MNITSLFLNAAEKYPDKTAIIEDGRSITFGQLAQEVKQTAAYYKRKGIGKGDRVLVFVPMGIDLYRIVLALFYCGATAVFLDEWVSKKRLEICCEIADCKGFIGVFKARLFALFSKELRRIPVKLKLKGKLSVSAEITELDDNDPALITFTTGSTGRPKAANRTHGFLKEQFNALIEEIDPAVSDVDMPVLPIVLFMNLGVGCSSVIADFKMSKPDQIDFKKITGQLLSNKVNRITASPFFVLKLAEYCLEHKIEFRALEKIFTGGAPVFPGDAALLQKAFPQTTVNIVYGSTEVEPISAITAEELISKKDYSDKGLAVGRIFHASNVRIIAISKDSIPDHSPASFETICLPEREIGEIVVSGSHVLKEYFNSENAFKSNKIIVGDTIWHRSGDSGFVDGAELYLTGRCAQLIVHNKDLISPFMIENQLREIQGISLGTLLLHQGHLVLYVETNLALDEVKLKLNLISIPIPYDVIMLVPKIPRDPRHNSKVDYEALEQLLSI